MELSVGGPTAFGLFISEAIQYPEWIIPAFFLYVVAWVQSQPPVVGGRPLLRPCGRARGATELERVAHESRSAFDRIQVHTGCS